MKKIQFWEIIVLFLSLHISSLQAQVSQGGVPYSFEKSYLSQEIPSVPLPAVDVAQLMEEDKIYYNEKGKPYRFGKEIAVDITLQNAGLWEMLPNGDRLWRCAISAEGATSINLQYSHFYLPQGATFFLYNKELNSILGAFTNFNNKSYQTFATGLVKGDYCVLEYYEPAAVAGQGIINVSKAVHGYRDFYHHEQKDYGDSGTCNNNVNCPEAADWQQEKSSVALILSGGFRGCTGAILSNIRKDCTPYFLTANHCNDSNMQNWIFMFNYESPSCTNADGPTDQTVSGAILRATSANSDFTLLELAEPIPAAYNIFYSGWSAQNVAGTAMTAIHHPAGDIKKITFDYNPAVESDNFWEMVWDDGTTEPGSSGSPLYDQNHRIVGQLYGGGASCVTPEESDIYGRFNISWNNGQTPGTRLKDWLNPDNDIIMTDGEYCNATPLQLDASLLFINEPQGNYCNENTFTPKAQVKNMGINPLTQILFHIQLDAQEIQTFVWNGYLTQGQIQEINLPVLSNIMPDAHIYSVEIAALNGMSDENLQNNEKTNAFEVIYGNSIAIELATDNYGNEISFEITDELNEVVLTEEGFANNILIDKEYCLSEGCYSLYLYDSWGDGLSNFTEFVEDDGNFTLYNNGALVEQIGGVFGDCMYNADGEGCSAQIDFCINNDTTALIAAFTASSQVACVGDTIYFYDNSNGSPNAWQWDFSGATLLTANNISTPSVIYSNSGNYGVSLTVSNGNENISHTDTDFITIQPNASAYYNVSTNNNLQVTFNGEGSTNYNTLMWDFGDGTVVQMGAIVTHTFAQEGTYEVCLSAQNSCDNPAQYCQTINVTCLLPQVGLSIQNQQYLSVSLSNNSSDFSNFVIDYGDGSSGTNLQHTFAAAGTYQICLTASNICGEQTACQNITVDCSQQSLLFESTVGGNGVATFAAQTVGTFTDWEWNFGDGSNSSEQNPEHQFVDDGNYEVCLTAVNLCGQNINFCQNIQVFTGITTLSPTAIFELYPNPFNTNFYVHHKGTAAALLKCYDIQGKLIFTQTLKTGTQNIHQLQAQAAGVYWLYIITEDEIFAEKIIKQ
ncbi:MAG: PKD domain-containing protein [Sphingobacteriales bacterium]|nr:PKD domain-containing protein [Sphingobacteriales bacterium]